MALATAQDRLAEKRLFERLGIPLPPYAAVGSQADLETAVRRIGLPAILKTRRLGYDGKGQIVLSAPEDVATAFEALGGVPCVLEQRIALRRELSILAVRGRDGTTACYPLVQNTHREGILRVSLAPAADVADLQGLADDYARRLLDALQYVGVLALELFVDDRDGSLLANEIAPRVHNSGHLTIEGSETSQFENHLRAILGLPLGSTAPRGWSAMVNLIGTTPPEEAILAIPGRPPAPLRQGAPSRPEARARDGHGGHAGRSRRAAGAGAVRRRGVTRHAERGRYADKLSRASHVRADQTSMHLYVILRSTMRLRPTNTDEDARSSRFRAIDGLSSREPE